jgi:nucleoid-associated protein YgaU
MGNRRANSILLATLLITVSAVAMAAPAGEPSFVPVGLDPGSTATSVMVKRGDHLWKISQRHLEQVLARPTGANEVDPFWRSVIEANQPRLRSGDADLIYPGETIVIPPHG